MTEPQTGLLTRAQVQARPSLAGAGSITAKSALRSRPDAAYDTPPLVTCSYWEYRPGMGTPVRIAPPPPRTRLPDPRWTSRTAWPKARFLIPRVFGRDDLTPEECHDNYLRQLERIGALTIAYALRDLPVDDGRICLLCFERSEQVLLDPLACHRRIFARWWEENTGREVPELTST
jgi:hypothetical protein